jgi:hypothetical protein
MHTKITISGKQNTVIFSVLFFVLFTGFSASAVTVTVAASSGFKSYQNISYSGPLVPFGGGKRYLGAAEDIIINSGKTFTIDTNNQAIKSITMGSGTASTTTLALGANTFTVTQGISSNTTATKSETFSTGAVLVTGNFSGSPYSITSSRGTIKMTGGNLPNVAALYNLTIKAPGSTVTVNSNLTVNNILELNDGVLEAATYNLTVKKLAGTAGVSGTAPSNNSFVRTSNGGKVTRDAGYGILYPVGAAFYAPVTLGLSVTKTFSVWVMDGVDNVSGDLITANVILNTWFIAAASSVNADVLVRLGWVEESKEGTNFDETKNAIFIFEPNSTEWTLLNTFTNETSNSQQNLAVNKFQNTDIYKFAVGDVNGLSLLNNTVALPVELVSFDVNKINDAQAKLDWSTAWETNNRGFEIERSTNGVYWTNIGFVAGNGNSNQLLHYTFPTSLAGINSTSVYYRLKQVDFNGNFQYSPVRVTRLNAAVSGAEEIYPNPVINKFSIKLSAAEAGETVKVTILDMTGKIVLASEQVIVEVDNFTLNMNVDNLKKGNYIVNISSVTTSHNVKLVKL